MNASFLCKNIANFSNNKNKNNNNANNVNKGASIDSCA